MIIAAVAFVIAIVAGFLAWFTLSGSEYTLVSDSYNAAILYITKGSASLSSSGGLGSTLYKSATSNPSVIVTFALALVFWPAFLVAGVIDLLRRAISITPFVWGLIAFIFAGVMNSEASGSLGLGAWVDLVAAIIWLVAYVFGRVQAGRAMTPKAPVSERVPERSPPSSPAGSTGSSPQNSTNP